MMKITVKFNQGLQSPHPNKVAVIKAIRTITDEGLKESKYCSEGNAVCIGYAQTAHENFDRHQFDQAVETIRSSGGSVYIAGNEWKHYEQDLKEMLFTAKMKGHESVIYELERLLSYTKEPDEIEESD